MQTLWKMGFPVWDSLCGTRHQYKVRQASHALLCCCEKKNDLVVPFNQPRKSDARMLLPHIIF